MQRLPLTPRTNWQQIVGEQGLVWHSVNGKPYWVESAYYRFTAKEIGEIETATKELYRLFLEAGQYLVDNPHLLVEKFGIPQAVVPLIIRTWNEEPPCLNHGRFDLGYSGNGPPKLFEYNCDTPTSMFEAAVVQWQWKEDVFPRDDQFTSLHDALIARWKEILPRLKSRNVVFACINDAAGEDVLTTTYLRDVAEQAGLRTDGIFMQDIGWDADRKRFVDLEGKPIDGLWKLYPWEWLVHETFGQHIIENYDSTTWMEPIWKMMWSNKAILPILWQLFPHHPNLLPSYFEPKGPTYVKKPKLAREGANITIVENGTETVATAGEYGEEGFIYQDLYSLPNFDGNYPVIGSWVVDGYPVGMGIREGGRVTGNTGCFVPHAFTPQR